MIISVDELKLQVDTKDLPDLAISQRLKSIETVIRQYCNNNFQNRNVRFIASSTEGVLNSVSPYIKIGDTVQVSCSGVNDGIYTVVDVTDNSTVLDNDLFDVEFNKITKIEYPIDVVQCAVDLFEWKVNFGSKIGVKSESETLSRHSQSMTYEDSNSLFMGYPIGVLRGLALYEKARC